MSRKVASVTLESHQFKYWTPQNLRHQGLPSPFPKQTQIAEELSLSQNDLYPPDVQRVVVEHIVRREDISSHSLSPLRLRSFSGRYPKPSNEVDYETWRSHVDLLLADPSLSPLQITRRILESLLSPAADVVKGLGPDSLPTIYLQVLDSAFATVQDGEELFARFLNTLQDPGEKPSAYLQRLQRNGISAVKRGGIEVSEMETHLVKQFCRGCWDNTVISNLQLEQRKGNPTSFAELLLLLRTEEDRQLSKETRMKKHMSSSQQRINLNSQTTCAATSEHHSNEMEDLRNQMKKLQSQLTSLISQNKTHSVPRYEPCQVNASRSGAAPTVAPKKLSKPRPWYCFKCGEDGHISTLCDNAANPDLVMSKRRELQQKQHMWDEKNTSRNPSN